MIADILPIQRQTKGPQMHPIVFQRPKNPLRGNGLISLDPKFPNEKGAEKQPRRAQRQPGQQHLPPPKPDEKIGGAFPPHHAQGTLQIGSGPAQRVPVPAGEAAGKGGGRLPGQIPKSQITGAAQIQHPLRKRALRPNPNLPPQAVNQFVQHGATSPTPQRQSARQCAAPPLSWPTKTILLPAPAGPPQKY